MTQVRHSSIIENNEGSLVVVVAVVVAVVVPPIHAQIMTKTKCQSNKNET